MIVDANIPWYRLYSEYCTRNNTQETSVTTKFHGTESFLRNHQSLSYSRILRHFMEPENSSPC
jgi:hypothetical protein